MLVEMLMVIKIMIEAVVRLIPYGILAIYPAIVCTRLATRTWNC